VTERDAAEPPGPDAPRERGAAVAVPGADRSAAEVLFGPEFPTISRYKDILTSRGIEWGVIGPREADRIWSRHILNSAAVASEIPQGAAVADVGSGAGLPGIPLAVLRPDLWMDLIEPLRRRSAFLAATVDELGMAARVTVRRARAEEVGATYDVVLSRALAPLDKLLRWCLPLMRASGQMLAIKGSSAGAEVDAHAGLIRSSGLVAELLSLEVGGAVPPTTVVRFRVA
jgi:16S rRNA (guanine527-N7)-methyltransferase